MKTGVAPGRLRGVIKTELVTKVMPAPVRVSEPSWYFMSLMALRSSGFLVALTSSTLCRSEYWKILTWVLLLPISRWVITSLRKSFVMSKFLDPTEPLPSTRNVRSILAWSQSFWRLGLAGCTGSASLHTTWQVIILCGLPSLHFCGCSMVHSQFAHSNQSLALNGVIDDYREINRDPENEYLITVNEQREPMAWGD